MAMALKALLLIAVVGSPASGALMEIKMAEGMWGPRDLDAVTAALHMILNNKHMTPEQQALSKNVSDDVLKDVASLAAGNLTKDARKGKVMHAIQQLTSLQGKLEDMAKKALNNEGDLDAKMESMKSELAKKQKEMKDDEEKIKLYTLQKELAEKKLQLEKLEETQELTKSKKAKEAEDKEAKQQTDMVSKLVAMAKGMTAKKSATAKPALNVSGIVADLEGRVAKVQLSISDVDAAEKTRQAEMDKLVKDKLPSLGKSGSDRAKSMLRSMKSQEHRKFEKARAVKKQELTELTGAIDSIKKGDVKALQAIMAKMQSESKQNLAKSGNFLY